MILRIGSRTFAPAGGFTLLEVLMAISILAVGTVSVLRAYSTSVSAIERSQYNIDAACLLKAVMGTIEEKAITQGGTVPGESSGELESSPDIKIDTTQSDKWQWSVEVSASGLQVKEAKETAGSEEEKQESTSGAETKDETKEEAVYSLNEVKLTVVNYERTPSNKVSVSTYMESADAESL